MDGRIGFSVKDYHSGSRRFCDDVLLDALHFLRRKEHAHDRLASRRLQWFSDKACARYPPRVVPRLEVRGIYALPAASSAESAASLIVANSMRIRLCRDSYSVDFPAVEPPKDIVRLSELAINDFVGPELLQFLRGSARLMGGGCRMLFNDFSNFVLHHSIDFIARFFALFPSKNRVLLDRLSSLAIPLFLDHPAIFNCTHLEVSCLDTFPLDALLNWLHLDEQQPPKQQKKRYLLIWFEYEFHVGHPVVSVGHFVHQLRQRFLSATSCCPFIVYIEPLEGPNIPEPDLFVEENERTGELLELSRDNYWYKMERRQRANTGDEEGDRKRTSTEERTTTTQMDKMTMVYIRKVVQGDKQPHYKD